MCVSGELISHGESVTWNSQFSVLWDGRPERRVGQRRADWSEVSLASLVRSFTFLSQENMEMPIN